MTGRAVRDAASDRVVAPAGWPTSEIDQVTMDDAVDWLDAQLRTSHAGDDAAGDEPAPPPTVARPEVPSAGLSRRRSVLVRRAIPTIVLALLFNLAVGLTDHLAARLYAVFFLLLVPGAVILAASRQRPVDTAVRLALAAATSLLYLMVLALVVDLVLPLVGVDEPFGRDALLLSVDLTLVPALLVVARDREPLVETFGDRLLRWQHLVAAVGLLTLPVMSAAGSQAVDNGEGPALAMGALLASGVLLVGVLFAVDSLPQWFVRASIYSVAVAAIYSFTFSGDLLFGWDIQQEFQAFETTARNGAWRTVVDQDPYRAMLSITALPAVLVRLSGISGVSLFRGVYPLLFATFPVLVHVVTARWLPRAAAYVAAAFVVVQLAFAQQLPAIARQEIALVFFGTLVAIAFDDALPVSYRRVVVVLAGSALAFTHYSTAYVTSLAMLAAWALGAIVRMATRSPRRPRVLALPVVVGILAFTVCWNFGVTRSGENVVRFTEQAAERGPEFLPSGEGRSVVARWLDGNAPQRITGDEYARRIELIYDAGAPWLNGYPDAVVDAYPVLDASTPSVDGLLPETRDGHDALLVVASQGFVVLTSLGVVLFAWRRRRDRSSAHELAVLGVALLAFVAAMRVSGVAAEAYNQERAQIHASAVLSVGFAFASAWLLTRWRRLALVGLGGALVVVFLASSGLAARIGGGAAPANLAARGDARERFSMDDDEIAAIRWLSANRYPDSIVYTDRYGKLRVWAAAVPIDGSALQGVLIPATLDRNAYVFATTANVVGGRARGAIGADYAVYEFPQAFLDANKATIYSTGTAEVHR